jgi:hypothetical protein
MDELLCIRSPRSADQGRAPVNDERLPGDVTSLLGE